MEKHKLKNIISSCANDNAKIIEGFCRDYNVTIKGKHLLKIACDYDSVKVVKKLIDYGVDHTFDDDFIFRKACKHNRIKVAKYLLYNFKHDLFAYKYSFLFACKNGHLDIVTMLLENKTIDVNISDGLALLSACKNGHLDVVKLLIEKGAFAYCRNNDPLKYACKNGYFEVSRILIKNGATINKENKDIITESINKRGDGYDILELFNNK